MNFEDKMNWLEREHAFPSDLKFFNNKRFKKMQADCGLKADISEIPGIVGAGSCGKASTLSFIGHIFKAAGLKCAVGVKPPLNESPIGNLERYQIWQSAFCRRMTEEQFEELFPKIFSAAQRLEREAPELGTAAPYDLRALILESFAAAEHADLLISEANIGRKSDPISCLDNTVMTLITPIGTDHGGLLRAPEGFHPELGYKAGPFFDKAEGLKLGKSGCFGRQSKDVEALLDKDSILFARDYAPCNISCTLKGTSFNLCLGNKIASYLGVDSEKFSSINFKLKALGTFQSDNAAQAIAAALVLYRRAVRLKSEDSLYRFSSSAFVKLLQRLSLPEFIEIIKAGLEQASVPGRLELVYSGCTAAVASSPEKLRSLLSSLDDITDDNQPFCVCASFLDRIHFLHDAVSMLASWPKNKFMIVTKYLDDDVNRDADPYSLAKLCPKAVLLKDAEQACSMARKMTKKGYMVLFLGNGILSFISSLK